MQRQTRHYSPIIRNVRLACLLGFSGLMTAAYGQQPAASHEDHASPAPAEAAASGPLAIELTSDPGALEAGKNEVSVSVMQPDGAPVDDAEVVMVFSMPAMPTMNMPAMSSKFELAPQGNGTYAGEGNLMMGGTWNVTIDVVRDGTKVGTRKLSVIAAE